MDHNIAEENDADPARQEEEDIVEYNYTGKVISEDYLTDASSLDALSEQDEEKDTGSKIENQDEDKSTPVNRPGFGIGSTTTPLFSLLDIHTPIAATPGPVADPKVAYLVGESLFNDLSLMSALKNLGIEVSRERITESKVNGIDLSTSILVFAEFSGLLFDSLRRRFPQSQRPRIFGPSAILATAQSKDKKLPVSRLGYPIYSAQLQNCRIAATGISCKESLQELRRKVLYMGGTYLERRSDRVLGTDCVATHLIAGKCRGTKYQDAVSLGKPILKPAWIDYLWDHRDNIYFDRNASLKNFRVKCFHACHIAFRGFAANEKAEMVKLVLENGGVVVEPDDPTATHIVRVDWVQERENSVIVDSILESADESIQTPGPSSQSAFTTPVSSHSILRNVDKKRAADRDDDSESIIGLGGNASPLKRARFELDVINDFNETEVDAAKLTEFGSDRAKIVKVEWFWNSIQIEACSDEKLYLIEGRPNNNLHGVSMDLDYTIRSFGTPVSVSSPQGQFSDADVGGSGITPKSGTPGGSTGGRRKRKRMREYVSSLAQVEYPRFISNLPEESGSGVPNLGGKSLSSIQEKDDITDTEFALVLKELSSYLKSADVKTMTRRQIEFYQLLETERNYVTVLMNIVKIFKEPCENEDQPGGMILSPVEVKTIFSTMLPIYAVHRRLLRSLFQLQVNWNEDNLIGKIYHDYSVELRKVYEPFVNFFESVKNEIVRCEAEKPRFLALLRIAQCKPECGKQTLSELIIRPVQRLPSTALILSNLAKHTPKSNPDSEWITKGLEALNHCIQGLNEGKAKNEARVAIFETFAEIDGCPAKTISNHRSLLNRIDVTSLCDLWGQKFDPMALFVYTDHIQVTKRRGGGGGSSKTMSAGASMANLRSPSIGRKSFAPGAPAGHHHFQSGHHKKFKFCEWIDFTEIKRVLDVYDTTTPSFAFVVRGPRDLRERILVFTCPEDAEWPKQKLLIFLAKQLANAVNRVDFENLIAKADSASLNVNENSTNVFEKAARFATKTRHKVGRALSLNRTPSKLKRTMSQMMSPFTSSKHRSSSVMDPDSVSQFGDSPPPSAKAKIPSYADWK